jgi:nucleotide-binding universal stress UspA family protein
VLPFKKIACPMDFSDASLEALRVANEIASQFSAELLLIHINPTIPVMPTGHGPIGFNIPEYEQEMRKFAEQKLSEIARSKVPADIRFSIKISMGDAASEIARIGSQENVDLIVIATHGVTGWRRFIVGSVTERVVRMAACPVLTIQVPEESK